ncbi:MAG: hypothetical protein ACRYE9_00320 [Janthinobacterium lividum]
MRELDGDNQIILEKEIKSKLRTLLRQYEEQEIAVRQSRIEEFTHNVDNSHDNLPQQLLVEAHTKNQTKVIYS